MSVDLRQCKKGDKLQTRECGVFTYSGFDPQEDETLPHVATAQNGNVWFYSDNGKIIPSLDCGEDIVEIMVDTQQSPQGRFERSADAGHEQVRAVYHQRGGEYSDTLETNDWLAFRALAKKLLGVEVSKDQARLLSLASLVDVKYERLAGGWKDDSLTDGLAYGSALLGELKALEVK